jgi:acetyl-CoA synthetase
LRQEIGFRETAIACAETLVPTAVNQVAGSRAAQDFLIARNLLLEHRVDYQAACREFRWPRPASFNWALEYFDAIGRRRDEPALRIVEDGKPDLAFSFAQMRERSNRLANGLRAAGVRRGDPILLMLGNVPALWDSMLAAIKLGCPIIPTTTLLMEDDLRDRVTRGNVRAVIAHDWVSERFRHCDERLLRIAAGSAPAGWRSLNEVTSNDAGFKAERETASDETLLLYFTSGTTAEPKLVEHTHISYPVGHLSTMYWLGLRPGDIHLNISTAGWAKHAWSSFFAPWNAEATVIAYNYERFDPRSLLDQIVRCAATSLCAPPTVWRALVQQPLQTYRTQLRELLSAGEPLNPEVIARVREAWGIEIRDGYGQTETTLQIGNFPGQRIKPGSMGQPAPGFRIDLIDTAGAARDEGEICPNLADAPVGVMAGYRDDPERTATVMIDGHYHTGDVASRDAEGYFTYVGRNDDVFKSSDYRISPFELESILIEHEAVVEAAVVPSPDTKRLSVPKAFVVLAAGMAPSLEVARSILEHCRARLSPFKRIRRIEFADLPKTISGKIRRVELRTAEMRRSGDEPRRAHEYWEDDFR